VDKRIRQSCGFIHAECGRAIKNLGRSSRLREAGNEKAAKALATRAVNQIERAQRASNTVMLRADK